MLLLAEVIGLVKQRDKQQMPHFFITFILLFSIDRQLTSIGDTVVCACLWRITG